MNLFTDPKRSIITNCAVATVIILWLAGSFLVDAFSQRVDAVRLQDSTYLQNSLFDVAVALTTERLDAYSGDSAQLAANDESSIETKTKQPNSDLQLRQTFDKILESNKQIVKPQRQSTAGVNQRLMETIEQEQLNLKAHREPNTNLHYAVHQSLDAHTAQIDRIKKLQSGMKYIPRFQKTAVDQLEQHRTNIQNLYTLLSLEVTLLASAHADTKAQLSEHVEGLANARGAQLPFWESIDSYHTRTMAVEGVADKTQALIEIYRGVGSSGLTFSSTNAQRKDHLLHILNKLRKLDNYLSLELNQMIDSSLAHANRRLFIDIFILVACLLMILTSVHVLKRLQHQATHDKLTKLHNWQYFENQLSEEIAMNSVDKRLAVISLDLEGFKAINDTLGYEVGDQLLIAAGKRLKAELRPHSLLARKSADEFSILQHQPKSKTDAVNYANELIECLREPFLINDIELRIGSSVGVSLYPNDANKASEMLNHADIAMHEAKTSGKDQVNVFNIQNAEQYQQRIQTERDLRSAIERNELELFYQPQVCARTGVVTGIEALIRWVHSTKGLVSPAEFISIAEESGLMVNIGQWIMEEACANAIELHDHGHKVRVAINISAVQFNQPDFVENVERIFKDAYFDLDYLELEVTESVMMNDMKMVIERLTQLRDMGIHIAIDDFGTGFSSLSYLQDLPLDSLKIDRAFITALSRQPNSKSVASTIVTLADTFELETVAEGVETDAQLHKVRELGCDYIQGYYYSKPVPLSELPQVIDSINQSASPQRKAA